MLFLVFAILFIATEAIYRSRGLKIVLNFFHPKHRRIAAQTNQNTKTKLGVIEKIILDHISSRMRTRHRLGVYGGH